jgi:hypothetical protein
MPSCASLLQQEVGSLKASSGPAAVHVLMAEVLLLLVQVRWVVSGV